MVAQFLRPHSAAVAPGLWAVLHKNRSDASRFPRTACALALLAPTDERWAAVAPAVAEAAVKATPAEFVAWSAALEPVGGALVPALMNRYPAVRAEIESGKLDASELVGKVRAAIEGQS